MYIRNFSFLIICMLALSCSQDKDPILIAAFGDSHINKYDFGYFFPGEQISNLGVNGLTTEEITAELENYSGDANVFVIHAGTNNQIKAFFDNMTQQEFELEMKTAIADLLAVFSNDKKYILIGSLPVTKNYQSQIQMGPIEKLWIDQSSQLSNIEFISSSILWDEDHFLDLNFSDDLIHLNQLAYQKLTAAINEKLD